MPDQTMIERVATAICGGEGSWSASSYHQQNRFRGQARDAIAAMREPTEAMANAGIGACGGDGSVLDGYVAMIDTALAKAEK